jgi:hypothetical protein
MLNAGITFTINVAYAISETESNEISPVTSHDYNGTWRTSNFTINLTAIYNESDINETYYRVNDEQIKTVTANGQPFVTKEGAAKKVEYWSVDNAGNQENLKILTNIKLDKTVPTESIMINDGAACLNDFNSSEVIPLTTGCYFWRCSDALFRPRLWRLGRLRYF